MYRELRAEMGRIEPRLVQLTEDLIRTPSVSLAERDLADRVQDVLNELEYDLVFRDEAGNVVGVMVGSEDGPTVLLNSHMDTAPPGDEASWQESPFSGRLQHGRIYGLGASDCKGGLAAQIFAGHLVEKSMTPLGGGLIVAATVAEENGCSVGLCHLLEKTLPRIGLSPDAAILGEPTSLGLCLGHDGWIEIDTRIEGDNAAAVHRAAERFARDLYRPVAGESARATKDLVRVGAPRLLDQDDGSIATISILRRLLSGELVEDGLNWARQLADQAVVDLAVAPVDVQLHRERQRLYTGMHVEVERWTQPWPMLTSEPVLDRAREVLRSCGWGQVSVRECFLERLGMGTAGSLLRNHYGIPTVSFGPGNELLAQAPNESVEISQLTEAAFGTAALVHGLISRFPVPVAGGRHETVNHQRV